MSASPESWQSQTQPSGDSRNAASRALAESSARSTAASSLAAASAPIASAPAVDTKPFARKVAEARKLVAGHEIERARALLAQATGTGRYVYLPAVVEGAYLALTGGETSLDVESTIELEIAFLAGTSAADRELAAGSWYNLALLYEKTGRMESARAALARSLALRADASVRAKLGSRSKCLAVIGEDPRLQQRVVTGWFEVCKTLQQCSRDELVVDDEARQRSCRKCSMAAGVEDPSHGCKGSGPWESTFGYHTFSYTSSWIARAVNERFFVAQAQVGSWPAVCRGSAPVRWELHGGYALAHVDVQPMAEVPGRPLPQTDPENGVCLEPRPFEILAVYALRTGKLLASVRPGEQVSVRFDESAQRLDLTGGNCDGHVPLDGSMRRSPRATFSRSEHRNGK